MANSPKNSTTKKGLKVPKVGNDDVAHFGNLFDGWEDLAVGQAEQYCTSEETQETGNEIIKLAFAAAGGAGTRSVTGEGHADPEDQPADHIANNVGGGHRRELD